ncbi:SpaH/EbpB family LPXTG-anchored major pilin [Virgibacillus sp.]|uniref:SpaH/EbpB family LPXTG-anchored major pilin n=1 Tax=Virgibacillus sp. TaxID=1872700 RepID=UPI0018441AD1|nr:SpaH/EbpB family LPXTG-anchored major pilin [Virgibacillus sp.]NWO15097.1 SpaH/EbpB family LPXTG-anchored major pilin [Virgibacillus sp.]
MQLAKKRILNIVLIVTLLLSVFLPQAALAYTVKGDESNPTLTIYKYEREPGATPEAGEGTGGEQTPPADATPLSDVEYTITQTHAYDPSTNKWTEVTDGEGFVETTDANGQVVITKADGLELGRYEVKETNGPDHVILNPGTFTVDIPMTNKAGDELNYDVKIYPKNETIRSNVELVKKDAEGNVLPGAGFTLYNADGTETTDKDGNAIGELMTDESGVIGIGNLAQGRYYFQETTAPEGYAINNTKLYFDVKKDDTGQNIVVEWKPEEGIVDENGHVRNYEKPEIEKDVEGVDAFEVDRDQEFKYNLTIATPKDVDKYKSLGVTDTLDDRLTFITDGSIADGWSVTGTDKSNINFNQEGQKLTWSVADLSQLTPGQEIKITFTAKIKPEAELLPEENGIPNEAELNFDNDKGGFNDPEDPPTTPPVKVDPKEGGLKVLKVDKRDNAVKLPNAEFKLTTDKDGKKVVDTTNAGDVVTVNGDSFNGLLENLKTDENGEISIEGLTPGTYYLHETKAPTYTDDEGNEKPYRLLSIPVEATVTNDVISDNNQVMVENSKSGWNLPSTGGIGTIIFTLVGLTLIGIALALYFRRKKQEATA